MDDVKPITYGSMIRLSLEGTGAYLKALDKGVPNLPNQNIVTVQPNDDEDALWEVESDADNPVALGEPVANLSIIRLRHKRTQKRLYSHEKPKAEPLGGLQQGTAFAMPAGTGDENDAWRLHLPEGNQVWLPRIPVALTHAATSKSPPAQRLSSRPGLVDSEYTNGLQGVVCSPDRNSDSTWFANDLFPRFTMRLKMVTIRGFRSIQATIQVPIDRNVTILIGANDHGKSNVLSAIRCLNDENGFQQNDVNWDLLEDATTPEIEWKFELNVDTALGDPSGPQDSSENRVRASSRVADSDSEKGRSAAHDTMPSVVVFRRSGVGAAVVLKDDDRWSSEQRNYILGMRPRIEQFNARDTLFDKVTQSELDEPTHEFMKGMFIKAGLWIARKDVFTQNATTSRALDRASQQLTKTLRKEWEAGKNLDWKFQHVENGAAIQLHIEDPAVNKRYVLPTQRSSGLIAFLDLSIRTLARTAHERAGGFIFLFDEPGTYLHPIAQINLQRVFESLSHRHQLVYTTHSLFLVNKNNPNRNIVVQKDSTGTTVDKKPFARNWKAARSSLGILYTHNFLISESTLLVEGPSDPVYLLACLSKLVQCNLLDIDLNDFSILDAGDEGNYVAMTKIMLEEGRRVVALLDGDGHGRELEDRLNSCAPVEIERGKLVIHVLPGGCSIEDLLVNGSLFLDAVCDAVKELLDNGTLRYKEGCDASSMANLRGDLKSKPPETTLGRHCDNVAKKIFGKRISKVNIAMKYELALPMNLSGDPDVPEALTNLILQLREKLGLRSQAAASDD